jgi:4-hydroxythreonine-4-phosphate dehydrogenase
MAQLCPHIALTLGDPAGVGPEVILKTLAESNLHESCRITIVGGLRHLETAYRALQQMDEIKSLDFQSLSVLDIALDPALESQICIGTGNAASGAASFAYLDTAIARTLTGEFDAIVTGPIAKSAWKAAGHNYPGQTELLAERAGVEQMGMLFVAESPHSHWVLRTLLATTHIPLRQVPDRLSPELLTAKLKVLIAALDRDFGIPAPHIAISGLNPHSGEHGQLGHEEQDWLIPWLETMRTLYPHIQLEGPIPPDTLWVQPGRAWQKQTDEHSMPDAYIALYHDQGLIPVKLLAFDQAVNTTIGLPFTRTSPDHGTAFDIAGRGVAQANSMKAALNLAISLTLQRLSRQAEGLLLSHESIIN